MKTKTVMTIALAACIAHSCVASARADVITAAYAVTADAFIDYKYASTNYSSAAGFSLYLNYDGKPSRMLCDLPEIVVPEGMKIESISLYVYCYGGSASEGYSMQAHALDSDYDLSSITWSNSAGTTFSENYAESDPIPTGYDSWLTFDLTSLWSDELEANGLIITQDEANLPSAGWRRVDLASVECAGYAPYLSVTFVSVPEPTATCAFLAGLGLATTLFRKNRITKG